MTAQISDEGEQLIHERARALVEAHFDSAADRLVLLHASAMMIAAVAANEADPISAATKMLSDGAAAALEFTDMATGQHLCPKAVPSPTCPNCNGDCSPEWGCDLYVN